MAATTRAPWDLGCRLSARSITGAAPERDRPSAGRGAVLQLSDVAPACAGGFHRKCRMHRWFVATHAILRVHFSLLTHAPRALRFRARVGPKP
eukprot:1194412-Prorocentrum_minimum.AAC.4